MYIVHIQVFVYCQKCFCKFQKWFDTMMFYFIIYLNYCDIFSFKLHLYQSAAGLTCVKSVGLLAEVGNSCIFLIISGNFSMVIFSQPLFVSVTLRHLSQLIMGLPRICAL